MFTEKCSECGSKAMLYDDARGEIICENCGLVANSVIFSREPEWRAYSVEEEKSKVRVGLPTSQLNNCEMRTIIGGSNRDSYGKTLSNASQVKYARLSQIDERVQDKTTRNLKSALIELKRIRSHLGLAEDVSESAVLLYKLALKEDLIKGRSVIGMMSAATYLACRKKGTAITLKDMAEVATISSKELGRCIRTFLKHINVNSNTPDPITLINRLGENLGLTMYTRKVAIDILSEAREKRLTTGKIPMSLAAAAIYIASIQTGERRTQQQIAVPARTTPVTIRNRFKELAKGLGLENFEVKRGAAAKPVVIKNPTSWVRQQRQAASSS
ncbi:MAG: transcription initiation factor IIB [Candidatus Heimdallarchaeota archaeon]|nr:transcription initiation factor IIB [Candidatus Heimdallarchaeota archaeon]